MMTVVPMLTLVDWVEGIVIHTNNATVGWQCIDTSTFFVCNISRTIFTRSFH